MDLLRTGRIRVCLVVVLLIFMGAGERPGTAADEQTRDIAPEAFPPVVIQDTERRELPSAIVDEVFKLHVYFPRGYPEMTDPLPVVYLLDAENSFGAVAYIIRRLIKDKLIPPVLLVGLAYEVDYDEYYRRRQRDFTPTKAHLDDFPRAGHAAAFARFLREECIPFVDTTYRTIPDDRTIMGLSFSGLFSTYAMFKEPGLFQRFVIVSPSLWWDRGVMFKFEEQYRAQGDALAARAFFAAGEKDGRDILRDIGRMEELLGRRQYRGLDHRFKVFPEETHRTVFPIAVTHGLRFAFAGPVAMVPSSADGGADRADDQHSRR